MTRTRIPLGIFLVTATLASCLRGPGFMQQSGVIKTENASVTESAPEAAKELPVIIVPTVELNGDATGLVQPSTDTVQVVSASANSTIAGSSATFPPGTVAVTTEVTVGPGDQIATDAIISELAIGDQLLGAGAPVEVSTSDPLDAAVPFTITIPLPDETSQLHLADPFEKLVILYRIFRASDGKELIGYFTRRKIDIRNGFASFETKYFGTFQAIITKDVLPEQTQEVDAPPVLAEEEPSPEPEPPAVEPRKVHFVAGLVGASFETNAASSGGLRGWTHAFSRARVTQGGKSLTTGQTVKLVREDQP